MFRPGPCYLALLLFLTLGAERAGLQADVPERSDRVVAYTIAAELIPEQQQVHGTMDLVWRNTSEEPVGEIYFHLYLNAFKDKDSSYLREGEGKGKRGTEWTDEYPGWIRVNWMRTVDGQDLWKGETRSFVAPDDGNEKDSTLARVALPAPVAPGETLALSIDFDSRLPRVLHRTGWAGDPGDPDSLFFMVAQWFPKIAVMRRGPDGKARWNAHQFHRNTEFFSDYGVYRVTIKTPVDFKVGATGKRVSESTTGNTKTVVHVQEDVHDFAWTASPHFGVHEYRWEFNRFCEEAPNGMGKRLRKLLERTAAHLELEEERIRPKREVTVRILLQPDHARLAERFRWAAGASLACYGIWFGEYPYDVLTIVDPPAGGGGAGGMEYPTLITVWGDRNAPRYATGMEGVTIHEFGHQYFYGLLGSNEFEEAWLDEGFTSYTDSRVFDVAYGDRVATTRYAPQHTPYFRPWNAPSAYATINRILRLDDWLGKLPHPWKRQDVLLPVPETSGLWEYLRDMPTVHFDKHVPVPAGMSERNWVLSARSDDSMVMPGWEFATRGDYAVNSYGKPTLFLYCLRGLMGEQAFDRALHAYATKHRFGHPTTEEFLEAVRAETGEEQRELVDGFIEAMIDSAARLDVAILAADQSELANGQWLWTIRVQRRGEVPVPIRVIVDGETIATWFSRGRETTRRFTAVRNKRFRSVRLGPDWLARIDSDISNNGRVAEGEEDYRPAAVNAARWSLWLEDVVRMHVGMSR